MKSSLRKKGIIILLCLAIVLVAAYFLFGRFYSRQIDNQRFDKMPISEFVNLVNSNEKHVWFYIYNNNDAQHGGLRDTDTIERIYIASNGSAEVYRDLSGTSTIADFEGLSSKAIVQRIESNMISGHNYQVVASGLTFLATPEDDNTVSISINGSNNLFNNYDFDQTVNQDEIVTDVPAGTLIFGGYLHQSESAGIFNKYQTLALLTPVDLVID